MTPPEPVPFRHEHVVRINDPANRLDAFITREQLWTGLWQTVVAPYAFDPTVDECTIENVGADRLARRLIRGGATIRDDVELVPAEALTIRLDPAGEHAGSSLHIGIEEPAPQMLFVRFTYELGGLGSLQAEEDTALRAAYEASDVDRIRQVRRYVARDQEKGA